VKKKKMKKTKLTGVVAIAMALTIVFSGVALASHPVRPTKETETLDITTNIQCNGTVVESQRLSLEIDSVDLLDNPPLDAGEKYGKIGYKEKMIASNGSTTFDNTFVVDTGTAPNLNVTKNIGYESGDLGSLSHEEQLRMKVISAGEPQGAAVCPPYDNSTRKLEKWKWCICPFTKGKPKPAVPGSCEEVNTFSKIVATDVQATTETSVGITNDPVNLNYNINAVGTGFVVAGVDLYVEDGRGAVSWLRAWICMSRTDVARAISVPRCRIGRSQLDTARVSISPRK
jgi:hypothetical protein